MDAMPHVIRADYVSGHRIRVAFDDGVVGTVDFEPWLEGPVFEPLKDPAYFRQFFIEGGTVTWPNGADIAPETLHQSAAAGPRT
jgi:hypothetical protein